METRICQNCQKEFQIEPEDFEFYKRIDVPPPTWCPECRMIRRMVWRNTRNLYLRKSNNVNEKTFSWFSNDFHFVVYDSKKFFSDEWDALEYGFDYNFDKPFFKQLKELNEKVPFLGNYNVDSINSDYCGSVYNIKNCFLIFNSGYCTNCLYGSDILKSNNCIDIDNVLNCDFCYNIQDSEGCNNIIFSNRCFKSSNLIFCDDLLNCHNCFGCINLKNKEYYIFNKKFIKEDYFKFIKDLNLGSYDFLIKTIFRINNFKLQNYFRSNYIFSSFNCSGNHINYSKNLNKCFMCSNSYNLSYSQFILFDKSFDSYDITNSFSELSYELLGSIGYKNKFCWDSATKDLKSGLMGLTYCMRCFSSNNLFGCVGLRNKQYCILNKQYTKDEYFKMVEKIKQHMNDMPYIDSQGRVYRYGEFFPPELSPFAYNETIAQEYFPKTKEEALAQGYRWKDREERNIKPDLYTKDLPDHIKDVDNSIIDKIIQCAHSKINPDGTLEEGCNQMCTTAFKIIEPELEFYKRMNLPLPRLCPNCRHFERLKLRNPLKLWKRKCQCQGNIGQNPNNPNTYQNQTTHFHGNSPCPNEFQTSYSPDRPEIVYCEECYNSEVV